MKKIYLPLLALLILAAAIVAVADTGHPNGNATIALTPPQVVNGPTGPMATSLSVTMNQSSPPATSGNSAYFFVYFIGSANQSVTMNSPNGLNVSYSNNGVPQNSQMINPNNFQRTRVDNPTNATININVNATINGNPYTNVTSGCAAAGTNTTGLCVTTYSDGAGDQAVIVVQDAAVVQ